jgi:hypothetical protein
MKSIFDMLGCGEFVLLVVFDFYDGLESGLALLASGKGVRFKSLGDSKSRCFRAFQLTTIEGDWWPQVLPIQAVEQGAKKNPVLIGLQPTLLLENLKHDVYSATALSHQIAIGTPYLEKLAVCEVSDRWLSELQINKQKIDCFKIAHLLLKERARNFSVENDVLSALVVS